MAVIVQKLRKTFPSALQKAIRYFSILSCLNSLNLTDKQIEVLAYTSIKGSITSPAARKEFIEVFSSSLASLENIKGKLVKLGWLVKIEGKYKVNPKVLIDFNKDIILQINLLSDGDNITR